MAPEPTGAGRRVARGGRLVRQPSARSSPGDRDHLGEGPGQEVVGAIRFEERDLVRDHGKSYEEYRRSVPMLIPFVGKRNSDRESGIVKAESDRGLLDEKG